MTDPPRVLILLATHNGRVHLPEQVASIAAQRNVTPLVLVRDDASSDDTAALIAGLFAASSLEYRVIASDTPSGSAARNYFRLIAAADLSGVKYVALCDQDDIWHPSKLARAIEQLDHDGADFYSSNSRPFWPSGRRGFVRKNYPQRRADHLFESASHGCTYVFTRHAATELRLFIRERLPTLDDIAYHDWLIYAWARERGFPWTMDEQALIDYRQSATNVIGANVGFSAARRRAALLRNGWLRHQALLIARALELPETGIVAQLARFDWRDRVALAANCAALRRRPRDAAVMLATMLLARRTAA